jgi:aryl carrier-like protein
MDPDQPITLHDLYPHFTDEQLEEAEANLERYLAVMMRIAERLRAEGYDLTSPDLTVPPSSPTIHRERSNSVQDIINSSHNQP